MSSLVPVYFLTAEGDEQMASIQMDTVVEKDGVVSPTKYPFSSAGRLRNSPLIGMWEDRTDIGDSVDFARKLRERGRSE